MLTISSTDASNLPAPSPGASRGAGADTINVAEFRWSCADRSLDVECLALDPTDQSIFSLTGLWDYAALLRPVTDGCYHIRRPLDVPWLGDRG